MSESTTFHVQVGAEQKAKAEAVLGRFGLTIGEAVELLVNRIAEDGDLPAGLAADSSEHDAWIGMEVRKALADEREPVPNVEVKTHFMRRRDIALQRVHRGEL